MEGGNAQSQVREEHQAPTSAAHCFYLSVHGSSCRRYILGPSLQDRQVQETKGGSGKTEQEIGKEDGDSNRVSWPTTIEENHR